MFKNSCRDENAWILGGAGKHFRRDSIAIAEKILACSAQKTAFAVGKEFLNNFFIKIALDNEALLSILGIATIYPLGIFTDNFADLNEVQTMFNLLTAQSVFDLEENQLDQLDTISQGSGEFAPGMAKGILFLHGRKKVAETCEHATAALLEANDGSMPVVVQAQVGFTVYPNPAKDYVTFQWHEVDGFSGAVLYITDLTGRMVWEEEMGGKDGRTVWETGHIREGVYFYQLKRADGVLFSGKIIIQQ